MSEENENEACQNCGLALIFNGFEDCFGCEGCGTMYHNDQEKGLVEFDDDEYDDEQ